ncbi:MAG TPA: CrcB family protein [Acidimicrobiales bacterium]|nr:CrcB family protein [Acidimicrobiales bacterium]
MTVALGVGLAGIIGALARYLVDGAVQDRTSGTFPAGTMVVNLAGSLVLGVVTGLTWYHGLGHAPKAVVGAGFCGAFTTWSTVSWETVRLAGYGERSQAVVHLVGGVAACLAIAAAGMAVSAVL